MASQFPPQTPSNSFRRQNQGMTCVYPAVDDGKAFAIVRLQDLRRLMVHQF